MARAARVVADPKVMMGKPVIEGTRTTVELILTRLGEAAPPFPTSTPLLVRARTKHETWRGLDRTGAARAKRATRRGRRVRPQSARQIAPRASPPGALHPSAHAAARADAAGRRHQPADAAGVRGQASAIDAALGKPAGQEGLAVAVGVDPVLRRRRPGRHAEDAASQQRRQPQSHGSHDATPLTRVSGSPQCASRLRPPQSRGTVMVAPGATPVPAAQR
jgi:Protein of unknown function (DUF433)